MGGRLLDYRRPPPPRVRFNGARCPMSEWPAFYYKLIVHEWRTMGPAEYGCLLVFIGVAGWLFMKSGAK